LDVKLSAYRRGSGSTVVGDLRILRDVPSPVPAVVPARDILVHLPSGALGSGRRYPVLYMHDGQNLFDAATSFSGEWEVDETLAALAEDGLELIVVGIPHDGDRRVVEYSPYVGWPEPGVVGGGGSAYLRYLVEAVKPAVDSLAPTRPEREATGILGSSLGGLVSLWAAIERGDTFGLIGAMSPAIPPGQGFIVPRLRRLRVPPERVYVDVGGREGSSRASARQARVWSKRYLRWTGDVESALDVGGLSRSRLRVVRDPDGIHHETTWARRLPDALRFLFGGG
jgi:predicted alpha/beta superfamily hydrolase